MRTGWITAGRLGIVALVGALLSGCASSREASQQERANRALQGEIVKLQNDLEEANRALALKDQELNTWRSSSGDRSAMEASYRQQVADRDATIRRMQDLLNQMDTTRLDPATDRALADLASRHRDLLTYDSERGMLRFNSDLTFDSGSDVVKEGAKQTLAQFAQILQGTGSGYDIEIVGHTDSQRISAGTAQRHPTNVHLSAHRAISVRSELTSLGIPAERMMVAGWGEHRPLVANTATGNTPQNRRVEIFLRRSSLGATASAPENGGVDIDRTTPPERVRDINK